MTPSPEPSATRAAQRANGAADPGLAAVDIARSLSWPVVPGTYLTAEGCSCGRPRCGRPGAHPADAHWRLAASTDEQTIARWWRRDPAATAVLPTGVRFDALDVPAAAGAAALARLRSHGLRVGPVLAEGDRWLFLVTCRDRLTAGDDLGRADAVELGIRYRGEGGWIVAPPARVPGGSVRWEYPPGQVQGGWPGGAELLGTIGAAVRSELRPAGHVGERSVQFAS
jgi:hypothetical protein